MKVLLAFFILFSTLTMQAQASLTGVWDTGKDNSKIEIKKENGVYVGRIASSDNPDAKIGNLILKDVKSVGGKWQGKLYSPKRKEWFNAVLKVEGKKLLITVKSGMASNTVEWTKQ